MASDQEACFSISSSDSKSAQNWKYDVFLSFRGEDTRKNFTDHLYTGLHRRGFKVFRDEEDLKRGKIISMELLKTIKQSRFAIIVVSQNYASSSWCLEELQHIISSHLRFLPIFHNVDPSHVEKLEGSFGEAFDSLKERFENDKVEKWRASLMQLAAISGWDSREWRYESKLIDDVVEKLWNQIYGKWPPTISDKLIGIDRKIREIELHMTKKLYDIKFIGIWGVGGVGKTTLAEAIYERFSKEFDFHCFLANVRGDSERNGLFSLQKKLLSQLIGQKTKEIEDTFKAKKTLQNHLHNKKVMLILDDVTSREQLMSLARLDWFGVGSRVIITTRDVHLLRSRHVDSRYEVKSMNEDESLQLFCQKAFGRDNPEEAFLERSKLAINYAQGLPLALCVLGSFFCGRSADEWEKALDMLKYSDNHISEILKISYGALNPVEKAIFLDIACFFNMWRIDEVTQILDSCDFNTTIGIRALIKKSLLAEVETGNSKYIKMHNLIQDMGRSIVLKESPHHVERRSRLWSAEEIDEVLENNIGTDATGGVALPNSFDTFKRKWIPAFSKMGSLRLLIMSCNNIDLSSSLIDLPCELKVLHWNGYPLETLLLGIKLDELVYLKMQESNTKDLHNSRMHNLKFLDLSHSRHLTETPDFSKLQKLERLLLEGCKKLVKIHPSLGQLKSLVEVNFRDCINLKILPTELEMASLEVFILSGCIEVKKLPEFGECMKNLSTLDAKETGIDQLPESVGSLINLETLDLRGCQNLVGLPLNIHKLKRLKVLDIYGCSEFSELPDNLTQNESLEHLDASETAIIEVPSSIGYLHQLKTLSFHGCKRLTSWGLRLPTSVFDIKSLTELDLSGCYIVDGFIPDDLNGLSSLMKLDLSGNEFEHLPYYCISGLLNLRFLYLNSCSGLQLLPKPSPGLDLMDAGGCTSLPTLSEEILLLDLFASIDQNGQYAERKCHRLNADTWTSLSIKTFSVTIPGSKIPSWFQSQKYLRMDGEDESSIIEDVPSSDWLGFALCTVLENDTFYSTEAYQNAFCWRYYFAKASDDKFVFLQGRDRKLEKQINSPHLWILFGQIGKQTCSSLSMDYSRLHLKFDAGIERKDELNVKCGWRVMSKMDFERLLLPTGVYDDQGNAEWHEIPKRGQRGSSKAEKGKTRSLEPLAPSLALICRPVRVLEGNAQWYETPKPGQCSSSKAKKGKTRSQEPLALSLALMEEEEVKLETPTNNAYNDFWLTPALPDQSSHPYIADKASCDGDFPPPAVGQSFASTITTQETTISTDDSVSVEGTQLHLSKVYRR